MATKTLSQKDAVLKHLKRHGAITSLTAFTRYGITRLSHVIYVLRKAGYNIYTRPTRVASRWGGATVATYVLK